MPVYVPENAKRVMPDPLRQFATEVLRRVQVPEGDAALIARYLVAVDLRGVATHGTRQLRRYVAEFREGRINPQPEIAQVVDAPAMAIFDGDGGAGYLVATRATQAVMEKAKANGVAVGCTRNHGHVGSAGDLCAFGTVTRFGDLLCGRGNRMGKTHATRCNSVGCDVRAPDVFWHSNGRRPALCAGYECEYVEGSRQTRRSIADVPRVCF